VILVAAPAIALALLSIAAFFGEWLWWLDVAANFRAQYVVALAVLGGFLLVGRWVKSGLAVLVAAIVNLVLVLPLFVGSPGPSDPSASHVRVMSFNLLSTNDNFAEVFSYIEEKTPDLVLLHEASLPWEAAAESTALGYEVVVARSADLNFGTLVLVKGEAIEAVSHGFAISQPRAVEVTFTPSGWDEPVTVLSTHPLAPTTEERAALRDAQLGFATTWAAQREGAFAVAGDFNATTWSWPFRRLLTEGGVRNSQIGFGLQPTFSTDRPFALRVAIDHLVHGERLRVRDRSLGPAMGSDHFPLLVDLELVP
jgi:endonuclease/exonuclease/phosphatase (EEP) superfamily protein YafD